MTLAEEVEEVRLGASMLAGGASAIAARCVTHPVDTLKARMQLRGALQPALAGASSSGGTTWHAARTLARTEGLVGFYRGFGACLLGFAPAQAAYFGGYEAGKVLTAPLRRNGHTAAAGVATGVFQQLIAGALFTPIDIIKERLQVQTMMAEQHRYRSPWHAAVAIVRARGVGGMLRGYWIGNAVWLPWNAIMIPSYEKSKAVAASALGCDVAALPTWAVAGCSAGASSLAVCLTHPIDVIKTRLQVLSTTEGGARVTASYIARTIAAEQGAMGFAAGLTPRLLTIVPGNALVWLSYEAIKKVLLA
eukprot:CAMPEP_0206141942 /NCGR_PEP_ID=MMETSP1473-20131121/14842_1 /ASSEMBLY_ACC=CAM_ASM_001109 /TAXON_ID=1461547 /ORGANISM="Stichococcus sp, Strain RCC1054" /LENGTH=305 /DNA_ID=CAMNT_0053536713 /DNA_START=230 /DNA_END=1147 /DNA_ORIENTATION=+